MKPSPIFLRGRPEADGLLLLQTEPNFDRTTDIWGNRRSSPKFVPTGIAAAIYNRMTITVGVEGESDGEGEGEGEGEGPDGPTFGVTLEGTNGDPNDETTPWFHIGSRTDGDDPTHPRFKAQYVRARVSDFEAGESDGTAVVDVTLWCD